MSGSSASSVETRLINDVEATCGRWLTNATSRSCRSGASVIGLAPTDRTNEATRSTADGSVAEVGARTQTIPSTTNADACSGPDRSEPPIGWPGTKRARSSAAANAATSAATRPLIEAASDTTASGAIASAWATVGATARIGVHTNTTSAPATAASSVEAAVRLPVTAARAATAGSVSHPVTSMAARAAASAIDVPISPVPSTAIRAGGATGSSGFAEVIPEAFRAVEVDVHDPVQRALGMEMHEDPDDRGHRAHHGDLSRAQQRDAA